jgi:WD40 repeat protein
MGRAGSGNDERNVESAIGNPALLQSVYFEPMRHEKPILILLITTATIAGIPVLFSQPSPSQSSQVEPTRQSCPALEVGRATNLPADPPWEAIDTWDDKIIRRQDDRVPDEQNIKEETITSLAFSPDGKYLATGTKYVAKNRPGTRGKVKLWFALDAIQRKRVILHEHESQINIVAFSPDKVLASGNSKGDISVWSRAQVESGIPRQRPIDLKVQFEPLSLSFNPNGRLLASAGIGGSNSSSFDAWTVSNRGRLQRATQQIQDIKTYPKTPGSSEKQRIDAIAFSPNGKIIAAAGKAILLDKQSFTRERESTSYINLWNVETGRYLCTLANSGFSSSSIAFSPNGTVFAAADKVRGVVQLWSLPNLEPLPPLNHGAKVNAIAFSPSGEILISGGQDKKLKLWKIQSRQVIVLDKYKHTGEMIDIHDSGITAVAFRPDGKSFATATEDPANSNSTVNPDKHYRLRTFTYPK